MDFCKGLVPAGIVIRPKRGLPACNVRGFRCEQVFFHWKLRINKVRLSVRSERSLQAGNLRSGQKHSKRLLMTETHFHKIKDIFADIVEVPRENRAELIHEKCGDDANLKAEIESLLAAHDEAENIIEKNAFDINSLSNNKTYDGREFGHYRILREIGHGGMGAVFLAERADGEFDQQVALKIVRQTIVSSELERHFRRERQILASLNHPNIAKLLDGGVSAIGEPFLAMEYIEGANLLEFAAEISIEEKLKLFIKVCNAVEYAHRHLVVHRDIKPSNILVTADGEPKLLDFGLAKPSETSELNANETTETAFRALTPAYASPEQLRGQTVTTSSDTYSLGVVLYELLSGEKPFHFENKSLEEILQTVTTGEPPPPSAISNSRLQNSNFKNPKSKIRNPKLKGDLDIITLKALRKEPDRRYNSVVAFAEDIERHLKGLPITARPQTFSYRSSKFFRRNKITVSAGVLILLSLFVGGIVSFVQFRRAQAEKAKAEQVNSFLQKMLLTANPEQSSNQGKGYSASINDLLAQATQRLDSDDFSSQPEVKAELEYLIGTIYLNQGKLDSAEKYLQTALKMQAELYDTNSKQILLSENSLGSLYLAKADYDRAENMFEKILPSLREQFRLGNIKIPVMADALNNFALLKRARGDSRQSEILYRESLESSIQNKLPDENLVFTKTMIALTRFDQGKFDEAEADVQKLLAESKQKDRESMSTADNLTLLGSIQSEKGNFREATDNLREGERIYLKLLSPDALKIFDNRRLQAQILYAEGNLSEAEKTINQVLENYRRISNPKYISYATALTYKGLILNKAGKSAEAETILREALRLRTENLPAKHFMTALTKSALGEVLTTTQKYDEAETLLTESLQDLKDIQAAENQRTLTAQNRLDELHKIWNKSAVAVR